MCGGLTRKTWFTTQHLNKHFYMYMFFAGHTIKAKMLRKVVLWWIVCLIVSIKLSEAEESSKIGFGESMKKEVCYDNVGCFSTDDPWISLTRPCAPPPNPKFARTKVYFYSKPFPNRKHVVYKYPKISVRKIPFRKHHPTYVIVHGSNASPSDTWIKQLKDTLIKQKNANIIVPDWSFIAKTAYPLNQVVVCGNVRTVAAEVSAVLRSLEREHELHLSNTNCIGHSFGAHVCGYIGKNTSGAMDTISALDACQPSFEGHPKEVRVVKGDAKFVMAIHTDAAPFALTGAVGYMAPYADVDFYFNGGYGQPGCVVPDKVPTINKPTDVVKVVSDRVLGVLSCPHSRAYQYFVEAVSSNNCTFMGHKADIANILESASNSATGGLTEKLTGNDEKCENPDDCVPVSLDTKKYTGRGVYVVTTRAESPFCASKDKPQNGTVGKETNFFKSAIKVFRDIFN